MREWTAWCRRCDWKSPIERGENNILVVKQQDHECPKEDTDEAVVR